MFGKKKLPFDKERLYQEIRARLLREEAEEDDPALEETVMEHVETPEGENWVKAEKKDTPARRPLANPESMPQKKEKAKAKTPLIEIKMPKKAFPVKTVEKKAEKKAPPKPLTKEEKEKLIRSSLDGMYEVYTDRESAPAKRFSGKEIARYAVLFLCIFGFLTAGVFVFQKLYDYYRSYVVYSGLREMVSQEDYFKDEYLKKTVGCINSLTPQDILDGKKEEISGGGETFTDAQENLVSKVRQLKKINPDTAGWITIGGTVVNYPVVWSEIKNYYLHRDFYGKVLSGGTIYMDERCDPNPAENLNTVIYGHNMTDGSMFASIHDFSTPSVFYNTTIELTTPEGIFIYKPFSVHESDAYDNYFETDFVSPEDFLQFCEQMSFISLYQTEYTFDKNTRIVTLSTCTNDQSSRNGRFAVHAVLTKVIR